jgi:hypothetical protein
MTLQALTELATKIQQKLTPDEQALLVGILTGGHYTDASGTVLLGNKALADAQRAADDARGGLVALACGIGR